MIDLAILVLYFALWLKYRTIDSMLALTVFALIAYTVSAVDFLHHIDDIYMFAFICSVYLILFVLLVRIKSKASIGCLTMSVYCLVYSLDSWVNGDVKTWIWLNHEILVCSIHAIILLLLSPIFHTLVGPCFYNLHSNNDFGRDLQNGKNHKNCENYKVKTK